MEVKVLLTNIDQYPQAYHLMNQFALEAAGYSGSAYKMPSPYSGKGTSIELTTELDPDQISRLRKALEDYNTKAGKQVLSLVEPETMNLG